MTDRGAAAKLDAQQALRLRLHRLEPPRPIRSATAAAAFVRERGLVLATGRSSLPVLAEAIVGRAIAGSWMADPEASRVYQILRRLRMQNIAVAPLILGKETLIDPALGPAVERVASDPDRRARVRQSASRLARRLLVDVERMGRIRMDRWNAPTVKARRARLLLDRTLLVRSSELHTERGYHTSVVTPWRATEFSRRFAGAAETLSLEHAEDQLMAAAARSAVLAPEQEARRWFVFGPDRIEPLIAEGGLERLTIGRRKWLVGPR